MEVVDQIIALVTKVMRDSPALNKIFLSFYLNDTQKFLPHVVLSYQGMRECNLMIYKNMHTLIKAKHVWDKYKELFWVILDKGPVERLTIQTTGKLPSMIGALGAMAEEAETRAYESLKLRLGET